MPPPHPRSLQSAGQGHWNAAPGICTAPGHIPGSCLSLLATACAPARQPLAHLEDTCCVQESRAHALSQISRALSCRPCMGSGEDRCCEHRTGTDVCRRRGPAGRSLPAPGKQRTGLLPLSALLPADVRLERTLSGKAEAAGDEKKPPFPGADTVCEQKSYALGMGSQVVPEKAHRA